MAEALGQSQNQWEVENAAVVIETCAGWTVIQFPQTIEEYFKEHFTYVHRRLPPCQPKILDIVLVPETPEEQDQITQWVKEQKLNQALIDRLAEDHRRSYQGWRNAERAIHER